MKGRKIAREYDNPVDTFLIDLAEKLSPTLKKMNFTPNHITTLGNIFRGLSLVLIYKKHYRLAAPFFVFGHFFDCADGYYARRYEMVSRFGDLYDHVSDIVVWIIFMYFITTRLEPHHKWYILPIFVILTIGIFIHIGCQEKIYNNQSVLSILTRLCYDVNHIKYTRYVGSGTLILVESLFIFFLDDMTH